jgi:thymidylate synthase
MSFDNYWRHQLGNVLLNGLEVSPRNKLTRELLHQSLTVDMRRPVLRAPLRKLDYRFMAAEAFWILSGDDRVESIAPFNQRIAEFSDDGKTFFGAYGPKIMAQLDYVLAKLQQDNLSRQAVITIWRKQPPPTKDVPCTVAISFTLREGKLNCHVFMRSSDLWLGLPYDVFNFSMLGHLVCARLNSTPDLEEPLVEPGQLHLTAVSSHLYELNWAAAGMCLNQRPTEQAPTPDLMHLDPVHLLEVLAELRYTKPGDERRWWEVDDEAI